jgi:hypothetical protein
MEMDSPLERQTEDGLTLRAGARPEVETAIAVTPTPPKTAFVGVDAVSVCVARNELELASFP